MLHKVNLRSLVMPIFVPIGTLENERLFIRALAAKERFNWFGLNILTMIIMHYWSFLKSKRAREKHFIGFSEN